MVQALVYKEWIKLRWFLLGLAVLSLLSCGNLFLYMRRLFEFRPAMTVWMTMIHDHRVLYAGIKYNAVIAGVVIAAVQFIPETTKRRLRLLFHLPVPQATAIYMMVGIGLLCTAVLAMIDLACLVATIHRYFPAEVVRSATATSAAWWLAGLIAYVGTALVLLEPAWWRKIAYGATAYFFVSLLMKGKSYELYNAVLWRYALLLLLFLLAIHLPAYRVKRGIR